MISLMISNSRLSCQTDIWRTVLLFSLLLLQRSVMSERKSFLTSSSLGPGFDWRMSEATTFRIIGFSSLIRWAGRSVMLRYFVATMLRN